MDITYLENWIAHVEFLKVKKNDNSKKTIDYIQSLNKDLETLQNEIDGNKENNIVEAGKKLRNFLGLGDNKVTKIKYLCNLMENGNLI
jgi:hypothetical protein